MNAKKLGTGRGLLAAFWLLGGLLLAFIVLPLLRMVTHQDPETFWQVAGAPDVRAAIGLSLAAALITSLIAAVVGTPLAYLLARGNFPGKSVLAALVDLPLAIPHTVVGIALLFVFGRNGWLGAPLARLGLHFWGTTSGIVVGMLFVSAPFMVNAARGGFEGVDERLEKVARTLGATPREVFRRISLPLALRGIFTGMVLTYARSISEFGAVVILAYYPQTAPVKIYELYLEYGLTRSSAMAVLLMGVSLSTFVLLRYLAGQATAGGPSRPGSDAAGSWSQGAPKKAVRP